MKMEQGNAKVRCASLGREGHGIPTFSISLDMGGSVQGFGGYDLRHESHGIDLLMRILDVVGCNDWSELKGQVVRYRRYDGIITSLGHVIEDRWLDMNP